MQLIFNPFIKVFWRSQLVKITVWQPFRNQVLNVNIGVVRLSKKAKKVANLVLEKPPKYNLKINTVFP